MGPAPTCQSCLCPSAAQHSPSLLSLMGEPRVLTLPQVMCFKVNGFRCEHLVLTVALYIFGGGRWEAGVRGGVRILFLFSFSKKRGGFVLKRCLGYLFNVCSDGFFFFLTILNNVCASAGLRVEAPGRNCPLFLPLGGPPQKALPTFGRGQAVGCPSTLREFLYENMKLDKKPTQTP